MSYKGEQAVGNKIYVYEATAIWNPDKKRSEQKRIYIGKKDSKTGEFIPNEKYYELHPDEQPLCYTKADKELTFLGLVDYGNIHIMNNSAKDTGLTQVLQECFPECWQEILVCAMHTCCEDEALYLCKPWAETSAVPVAPSSQQISWLLKTLDENRRMEFYQKWAKLRSEREYIAMDITSISSWSELIEYVEYGYKRDHEKLPQINLLMLFGEESRLPVFSRIYPGSIKDVLTLTGMITFIEQLKLNQMHFVMDKGFYSEKGIKLLSKKYIKFAVGVPFTTSLAKELVEQSANIINTPLNAIEADGHIYYAITYSKTLYNRRMYLHVYFDETRQVAERTTLMQKVLKIEQGLVDGKIKLTEAEAKKYFTFHKTKDGCYNIHRKEEVIQNEKRLSGYFVIITNDSKDPTYILETYRTKDAVEKSFDNLKNELDLKRLRIHSDDAMEGRIFIGFISLILMSYIREKMRKGNLYKTHTFSSLLKELKK